MEKSVKNFKKKTNDDHNLDEKKNISKQAHNEKFNEELMISSESNYDSEVMMNSDLESSIDSDSDEEIYLLCRMFNNYR